VQKVRGGTTSYVLSPRDSKRPSSSEVDAEKASGIPERRFTQKLDCSEDVRAHRPSTNLSTPRVRVNGTAPASP
jgi:hypothetical protein